VFHSIVIKLAVAFNFALFFYGFLPSIAFAQDPLLQKSKPPKPTAIGSASSPAAKASSDRSSRVTVDDGSFDPWGSGKTEDAELRPADKPLPPSYVGRTVMPASFGKQQWKVTRTAWTMDDEVAYGEFLRLIGESTCKTTHECLTSPTANPNYHAKHPQGMQFFADCADLPFILRAYFAWMNGLPYSFSGALDLYPSAAPKSERRERGRRGDFASFVVTGRREIGPPGPDAAVAFSEISNIVSTNHFRYPAAYKGRFLPDHYPVRISKATIKPGVVIFDPLGHIAVVYKVTDDGEIFFIDAHPDNALTRGTYGSEVERAGPETGAGFKAWRPQKLVNAARTPKGDLSGGEVVLASDRELPDWSDEQYYGVGGGRSPDWKAGRFSFKGDQIDYFGYVRLTLARDGFRYDPIKEMRTRIGSICKEFGYRIDAVEAARKANIDKQAQPVRLPTNIYVTQGYWEAYATPSRDAQLKSMFVKLKEEVGRYIMLHENGSTLVNYTGTDLKGDLLRAYSEAAAQCSVEYKKSDLSPVVLGFKELKQRLFKMSFDPHHCAERRWGATDPAELATCQDDSVKRAWYDAEQRLRNQLVRTIGDRMDFTIEDLKKQARENSEVGETEAPDISIEQMLAVPTVLAASKPSPNFEMPQPITTGAIGTTLSGTTPPSLVGTPDAPAPTHAVTAIAPVQPAAIADEPPVATFEPNGPLASEVVNSPAADTRDETATKSKDAILVTPNPDAPSDARLEVR